ncbi:MAG TPA: VOC family protein [Gaiellaceae bacterium]|nr:VOC family protein [Gaiellaceae bacterium]
MIGAERVDFVAVPTRDRERAAKFYGETLGLRRNPNSSEMWIEFETANLTIALLPHEFTGRSEFVPSSGPIALRVPDVHEARRKLEQAGVEFQMETIDSGVCLMAPFPDPDGNSLMLHSRYAPFADGTKP